MTTVISGSSPSITFSDSTTQSTTAPSTSTFGFKNRIINGGMTISQRGTSFNPATNGVGLDRWTIRSSPSASAFSVTQSTSAPTGFLNSQLITSLGTTTVGSGDYYTIDQRIETANAYDFAWGTASAKTVTLSFWVYSSLTGTFAGGLNEYNSGSVSYGFNYSIPTANTWTQISVTIPGPTTGTWNTTLNGGYMTITFGLGVGSSSATPTNNSWVSGNYRTGNGGVNVVSTSGATFYITGVQLEVGTQATSFDFRDYGRELILCQRYYTKFNALTAGTKYLALGYQVSDTNSVFIMQYPVTLRSEPTCSISSLASTDNVNYDADLTLVSINGGYNSGQIRVSHSSNGAQYRPCSIYKKSGTSGYIDLSSEL